LKKTIVFDLCVLASCRITVPRMEEFSSAMYPTSWPWRLKSE
jgi:hypothetical protein